MSLAHALKGGVDIRGIAPECVMGILIAAGVYEARGVPFVVTSVRDGKHMQASYHYRALAFDCRLPSRYTANPDTDKRVTDDLRASLGQQFDVVLEGDHIHVEFDPKTEAKP